VESVFVTEVEEVMKKLWSTDCLYDSRLVMLSCSLNVLHK
jgi:hypothetical protein